MQAVSHNTAAIEKSLAVICGGDVVEIRALGVDGRKGKTASGYFDDYQKAAQAAARIKATGIYFTPNCIDESLLARANNRIKLAAETTADHNVTRRKWLLIDLDPQRAAGISASDAEKEAAKQKARDVYAFMQHVGFTLPIVADSGNGVHLLYRVDFPKDDEGIFEKCLKHLADEFDDPSVKVDTACFNPARIWKLYGTTAAKGENIPDRPHRLSQLLTVPPEIQITGQDVVLKLAKLHVDIQPQQHTMPFGEFDIRHWLREHSIEHTEKAHNNGTKFMLAECPFNPEHKAPDAVVFERPNGFGFKCFHNSCSGFGWREFREHFEPDAYTTRYSKRRQSEQTERSKRKPQSNTLEAAVADTIANLESDNVNLKDTGIPELDYALGGGIERHEMVLVGARPSHGKSAFALQCCHHATLSTPALFISEEMSRLALGKRTLQFASDIPLEYWPQRQSAIRDDALNHFGQRKPCYIEESLRTIENVSRIIHHHAKENAVEFVAVDYAQLIQSKGRSRFDHVTQTSIELRRIANECNITLVVLCQLSRAIENRDSFNPKMNDLRESGQLEQDADVITFLVWPHRIDPKNDPKEYRIYIAKNRNRAINQQVVKCEFNPSRQTMQEQPIESRPNYEPAFSNF